MMLPPHLAVHCLIRGRMPDKVLPNITFLRLTMPCPKFLGDLASSFVKRLV